MKQTVAIIGASEPDGSALALTFARAGCRILLSGEDPQRARGLVAEIQRVQAAPDVEILDCARTSCWEADIIVVASPAASAREVADKIREVSTRKIVVAAMSLRSAGEPYGRLLPHSRLVTLSSAGSGYSLSSDDRDALETVRRLLDAGGSATKPASAFSGRHSSAFN